MVICQNVSPMGKVYFTWTGECSYMQLNIINMSGILWGCEPQEDRFITTFCKTKHIGMVAANDHRQLSLVLDCKNHILTAPLLCNAFSNSMYCDPRALYSILIVQMKVVLLVLLKEAGFFSVVFLIFYSVHVLCYEAGHGINIYVVSFSAGATSAKTHLHR